MDLIIKDIDTLKKHFPVNHTDKGFRRIVPYIELVQSEYLEPVLGEDLLQVLITEHNDGSQSGSESGSTSGGSTGQCLSELLNHAQRACAFLAIYEGFSQLEIQIGLNGITQKPQGADTSPIFSGQRTDAKLDILKHGMNFLENMIVYMEKNKDANCLSDWADSDERTDMVGHILPTAKTFTQYWGGMGNKRLTYMALKPRMLDVEQTIVQSVLGEDLYEEVFDQLKSELNSANAKLMRFLMPMVAKFTAAQGMPELQMHIEAYGVYHFLTERNEKTSQVLKDAKDHRVLAQKQRFTEEAEMHRQDLINYLNANVEEYPLFKESDSYIEEETETDDTGSETTSVAGFL